MVGSRRVKDEMELRKQRTVRFHEERAKPTIPTHQKQAGLAANKLGLWISEKNKIFLAGNELWYKKIIDPSSDFILTWNYVLRIACFVALFMDPLYFYVPKIYYGTLNSCIGRDTRLAIIVTVFRSITDLFYVLQIIIKFRTAYINPSSTLGVFGRDLVKDPGNIAKQYLRSSFVVDLVASLPLPQIIIWSVIPSVKYSLSEHDDDILLLIALFQYVLRLYLVFSLNSKIVEVTGAFSKTAWQGAAYNLLLYMIASHVLGALWYLLSVDRQTACWEKYCSNETGCQNKYLACDVQPDSNWKISTTIFNSCNASNKSIGFDYGMFTPLLSNQAPDQGFLKKFFYCLWWGLQNLSCYGQTLTVSTYIGETLYAIFLAVLGLVLFAHLIGNVQVPFFSQMDDRLLDAICERLVSSLSTVGTYIVREGDPVTEMLFIIRGKLESSTTDGGRTGFFNSITLKTGDFCGEELLGWALVPKPTVNLPSSTRTVKTIVEVEAFALRAEDLKFVASQFRRLHSRKLQHTFRYYSHHWRTWAACFIQAAWRRYKRRRLAKNLSIRESFSSRRSFEEDGSPEHSLVLNAARKGAHIIKELPKFRKPSEPDFSAEHDD
uniref:Cyclic nucleotide-binding domain-containing protein n=1 Tax=Oryza punctata TaxID=4537 RepID=A0A0E0L8T6_ORYPU